MTAVTIYLIGPEELGKHAIAQALGRHHYKVIDNHLIDTPILSLVTRNSGDPIPEAAWQSIQQIRQATLDFMAQDLRSHYVLTNALHNTGYDRHLYTEVKKAAELRKSLFLPVQLTLAHKRDPIEALPITHPHLKNLDITTLTPIDTAKILLDWVQDCLHTPEALAAAQLPVDHVFITEGEKARANLQIREGMKTYNCSQIGPYKRVPFTLHMQNETSTVIAGITGHFLAPLCTLTQIWVQEHYCHQKLGTKLMQALENYLKEKGCNVIQAEVEDFQVKAFYEKMGFNTIANFDSTRYPEHKQYIMRKTL